MMSDDELRALAVDIRVNGQRESIKLADCAVLDGEPARCLKARGR